ncbi:hypothetical protein niasHT_013615 [Heterodera trifolii]|uniref:Uncharacterized protein n=1 Tax=Heterodera trifolii TaxID=157864 RepID=A0ABD2LE56_9BILA
MPAQKTKGDGFESDASLDSQGSSDGKCLGISLRRHPENGRLLSPGQKQEDSFAFGWGGHWLFFGMRFASGRRKRPIEIGGD